MCARGGVFVTANSCVDVVAKVKPPPPLSLPCPAPLGYTNLSSFSRCSLTQRCLSPRHYKWARCRLNAISKCIWRRLFCRPWAKSGIFSCVLSVPWIQLPQLKKKKTQWREYRVYYYWGWFCQETDAAREINLTQLNTVWCGTGEKYVWLNCDGRLAWLKVLESLSEGIEREWAQEQLYPIQSFLLMFPFSPVGIRETTQESK